MKQENKWIRTEDRLPRDGQAVLVFFKNSYGRNRICKAEWYEKHSLEATDTDFWDNDILDYQEETDTFFCPSGFYESNENDETMWLISETVTHWQPLPEPPKVKGAK